MDLDAPLFQVPAANYINIDTCHYVIRAHTISMVSIETRFVLIDILQNWPTQKDSLIMVYTLILSAEHIWSETL